MGNVAAAAPAHYLSPAQAAELLGVKLVTLQMWRSRGTGPEWIKVSRNIVRYERSALIQWLDERRRTPGSAAPVLAAG